jgi:formylglycine-generating enzyme required for sulfatase activity
MNAGQPERPTRFIVDQRLFHLVAPGHLRLKCLEPELFRTLRETACKSRSKKQRPAQPLPNYLPGCRWRRVRERTRFLADPDRLRWCFTVDAGGGKTTILQQMEYLRHVLPQFSGHMSLLVKFSELPTSSLDYLDGPNAKLLVLLKEQIQHDIPLDDLRNLLRHRIRSGQFTLLVDALDQTDSGTKDHIEMARALAGFLRCYPSTRCIVSGRLNAIQTYRRELFDPAETSLPAWDYVLVDIFGPHQIRRFLGKRRAALLDRVDADALAIPRTLRAVLEIPKAQLASVRTASDIYWRAIHSTLDAMLNAQRVALDSHQLGLSDEEACQLLGAVAFQMIKQGKRSGVPKPEVNAWMTTLWSQCSQDFKYGFSDDIQCFKRKLISLARLNAHLEYSVMETKGLSRIEFSNPTIMDFFAALWITRYASDDDRAWLSGRVYINGAADTAPLREVWKLAAEMPGEQFRGLPAARDDATYAQAMSALYGARAETGAALRSTQMIYRSWPAMLHLAGFLSDSCSTQAQIDAATCAAQDDVWMTPQRHEPAQESDSAAEIARRAVLSFLGEFPNKMRGTNGPEAQKVAQDFCSWFVPIPEREFEALTFWMGDETSGYNNEKQHASSIPGRIQMAKYPVTNRLMALFDARHGERFEGYKRYSPELDCPAIYVDWYTAWCVALWLGCRLPTEQEWEYACRAQAGLAEEPTKWHCGDDEAKLATVACYFENSKVRTHMVPGKGTLRAALDRLSTHVVNGNWKEGKQSNRWGLYHMHGNVWEWTSSWYHTDAEIGRDLEHGTSHVLRGGAFHDYAGCCRSAYRSYAAPSISSSNVGFRVVSLCFGALIPARRSAGWDQPVVTVE